MTIFEERNWTLDNAYIRYKSHFICIIVRTYMSSDIWRIYVYLRTIRQFDKIHPRMTKKEMDNKQKKRIKANTLCGCWCPNIVQTWLVGVYWLIGERCSNCWLVTLLFVLVPIPAVVVFIFHHSTYSSDIAWKEYQSFRNIVNSCVWLVFWKLVLVEQLLILENHRTKEFDKYK